jgi:hypothetical protein
MTILIIGMPMGLDAKLAARLHEIGPVSVSHPETKIPAKVSRNMRD